MSLALAREKASVLVEALPYIREYHGRTVVVKIGGQALDDPAHARLVAEDLALLALVGVRLIVVHGGGPQVSDAMQAAGLEPRFVGGLRVTDEAAMEVVSRVLIGTVNASLVATLGRAGLDAVGLSGVDSSLLAALPCRGPGGEDLGRVGRVVDVKRSLLDALLDAGHTPVVASVAAGRDGIFNVNADEAAAAIAASVDAVKLIFLTNVEGLYRDLGDGATLVSELKGDDLAAMLPSLSDGMRPKAQAAVDALSSGVTKVHMLDGRIPHALLLEIFTEQGIGTQVLA